MEEYISVEMEIFSEKQGWTKRDWILIQIT